MHTNQLHLYNLTENHIYSDLRSFDKEKWQDDFLPTLRQDVRGLFGKSSVAAEVRNDGGAVHYSVCEPKKNKKTGGRPLKVGGPPIGLFAHRFFFFFFFREAGERERTGFSAGSTKGIGKASRAKVSYLTSVWPLFFGPTLFTARG